MSYGSYAGYSSFIIVYNHYTTASLLYVVTCYYLKAFSKKKSFIKIHTSFYLLILSNYSCFKSLIMSALNNPSTSTDQNDPNKDKSKTPKSEDIIMKNTPDNDNKGPSSLYIVTKATKLFVQKLAQDALKGQKHYRHLEYNDFARAVEENENMNFLSEIIPTKNFMAECYNILVDEESSEDDEDNDNSS
ncbi:hypothetical protein AGLY_009289 [Aphis glycines]|uniref:Transcription factor CBF/NF-Y/archaeal histone domain-containing protein n=1 Tax=Aphis glycines TaxID=307491 RepID=A0A6G0THY0_APHGL|nr:hypothetical protein AGLY_009289 [Aphis glycines]